MYISAFPHRDELFEIATRWISGELAAEDPLRITRIVTYDGFAAWETLLDFMENLNPELAAGPVFMKQIATKRELKDFICAARHLPTPRTDQLISEYNALPEYHYVGAPLTGRIYHDDKNRLVSLCRFKRVKRIAEKASRYAADHIIKWTEQIAADLQGNGPMAPPGVFSPELLSRAEKELMLSFKAHGVTLPAEAMTIRDIIGVKIVQDVICEETLEAALQRIPGIVIREKEPHTGQYNAVHYTLDLPFAAEKVLPRFGEKARALALQRGIPATGLLEDGASFMATGSDSIQIDLILTSFEEFVESEIGRSMHESRIFNQRTHQNKAGNISINIEYIVEYMLAVGLSPTVILDDLPIKIWGRYLPDAVGHHIRNLYQMPEYSIIHA